MLSIKEIDLVVYFTLVKPSAMLNLDGIKIITQLKVQNHRNNFETISTTVLRGLLFRMLQTILKPGKT